MCWRNLKSSRCPYRWFIRNPDWYRARFAHLWRSARASCDKFHSIDGRRNNDDGGLVIRLTQWSSPAGRRSSSVLSRKQPAKAPRAAIRRHEWLRPPAMTDSRCLRAAHYQARSDRDATGLRSCRPTIGWQTTQQRSRCICGRGLCGRFRLSQYRASERGPEPAFGRDVYVEAAVLAQTLILPYHLDRDKYPTVKPPAPAHVRERNPNLGAHVTGAAFHQAGERTLSVHTTGFAGIEVYVVFRIGAGQVVEIFLTRSEEHTSEL